MDLILEEHLGTQLNVPSMGMRHLDIADNLGYRPTLLKPGYFHIHARGG